MKTLSLIAAAAGTLTLLAGPAFATPAVGGATGTVTVQGSVASKCSISGNANQTLEVGDLSQTNGQAVTNFDNAGNKTVSFSVVCTSGNPTFGLSATSITDSSVTPGTGYTNVVEYEATLTATGTTSNITGLTYQTNNSSPPAAVTQTVGSPLANSPNNVAVSVSGSSATGVLVASGPDGYKGTITFTVSPT